MVKILAHKRDWALLLLRMSVQIVGLLLKMDAYLRAKVDGHSKVKKWALELTEDRSSLYDRLKFRVTGQKDLPYLWSSIQDRLIGSVPVHFQWGPSDFRLKFSAAHSVPFQAIINVAVYLRKRMIESVLWIESVLCILVRWISFLTFSDFVKSDMDSAWYFCRLINCESQIHWVTHWDYGSNQKIISRNLFIGQSDDAKNNVETVWYC